MPFTTFTAGDATSDSIDNAVNPMPNYGYVHGPIANPNTDFVPPRQQAAAAAGQARPSINMADNAAVGLAPGANPRVAVSHISGGVCHMFITADRMCGTVFANNPAMYRHYREQHPGAIQNPPKAAISAAERAMGEEICPRWSLE
ncbi:hypothetical protein PG995_002592 [Apiospora arundinis]